MKHTKIYGAIIIIVIALALFLLVFFGVNIRVSKSVTTHVDPKTSQVLVYLEGKQAKYVKNNTDKYYYIYNPANDLRYKCKFFKTENNLFLFKDTKTSSVLKWENLGGIVPAKFDFGNMKLFQYFVRF